MGLINILLFSQNTIMYMRSFGTKNVGLNTRLFYTMFVLYVVSYNTTLNSVPSFTFLYTCILMQGVFCSFLKLTASVITYERMRRVISSLIIETHNTVSEQ